MMQPRFDDVVEYVKSGEVDPEMRDMLDGDPDGQELLKQARFICRVLQSQLGESDGGQNYAASGRSLDQLTVASEMPPESYERKVEIFRLYQPSPSLRAPRRRRPPSLNELLENTYSARQDLGTLQFAVSDQHVLASFQPSAAVITYAEKFLRKVPAYKLDPLGIQIQSPGLNIALSESTPVGNPIVLRLSKTLRQTPASRIELLLMPESGPFIRLRCDDEGDVELPRPIQSGTLRIGRGDPQILRIEVKKP